MNYPPVEVLKHPNGQYMRDTREFRRLYPDAVPMRIAKPGYEEAKRGIRPLELPYEEPKDAKARAKELKAVQQHGQGAQAPKRSATVSALPLGGDKAEVTH